MTKAVTVQSQIKIIQIVACAEIGVSLIILLCQTISIAASYEFATRSLTGIWVSYFFFMASGFVLLWSVRCSFNGLLAVLVFQLIAATMSIPLFTASCILLGVYPFVFEPEFGAAMVGSTISVISCNTMIIFSSIAEMGLNSYCAYKCYFLAYGGQPKENNYDRRSISSSESVEVDESASGRMRVGETSVGQEIKSSSQEPDLEPSMPSPTDLTLSSTDILIIKYCGVNIVILAVIIFCSQTTMLALSNNAGIKIGIGVWGSLFYTTTGLATLYTGFKISSQSTITIFALNLVQLILSIPVVCISYYIVASFGSCLQLKPFQDCTYVKHTEGFAAADLAITILGGLMAISGMAIGLVSTIVILITAQAVCGFQCMISGATVYPML